MKAKFKIIGLILCIMLVFAGCGCKHEYKEATCTEAATCTKCGATEGSPLGHSYGEATCTKTATCTRCGAANGSALGHSTEFGTCSRCGEFQGKDIAERIVTSINNGNSKINEGNTDSERMYNATTYDQMYSIMCDATDDYQAAAGYYKTAINLCGSYSQLSTLKSLLQSTVNACPADPYSSDKSALESWVYDEAEFRISAVYIEDEAETLASKIGKTITALSEYQ